MVIVKALIFLMFTMFAMTTGSVGIIILEVIKTFQLSLTAAGTFQYATLPLSGLFMSVVYSTINSKGISCLQGLHTVPRRASFFSSPARPQCSHRWRTAR